MEISKNEFVKAYAMSLAKMAQHDPMILLMIDEMTTLGAILTSELFEKEKK